MLSKATRFFSLWGAELGLKDTLTKKGHNIEIYRNGTGDKYFFSAHEA